MKNQITHPSLRIVIQLIIVLFIMPLLPMLISKNWGWWEAWVVAIVIVFGFSLSRHLAAKRHPDILKERSESFGHKEAKKWDHFLAPMMAFGGTMILIVAGLEERFNWTPQTFPLGWKIAGFMVLIAAYIFSSWALIENAFFSGTVRIQTDRGHTVCDSGPYRIVRHPGYAGSLVAYLVMPLILDSTWGFIAAALLLIVTVIRTNLEDRTLQMELPGYREFSSRTKYRLFPGIW